MQKHDLSFLLPLLFGLFAIVMTAIKPSFYWNSYKARRMRDLIGDQNAALFYYGLGVFLIGLSMLMYFQ